MKNQKITYLIIFRFKLQQLIIIKETNEFGMWETWDHRAPMTEDINNVEWDLHFSVVLFDMVQRI